MSELNSAEDKELDNKVGEELEIEDSLLEPAIQLSTEDNGLEQNEDQFFPFDNLSVEINEGEEENTAAKESSGQQSTLFEESSINESVENRQELSNLSSEIYNSSAIENAAADSTVPESNESSQDVTFEEDAVIKTESEVYPATNLADYLYSETSMNYDEGSNSASEEMKDETKKVQLYRFPKIMKNVQMAEYETLQVLYQLLYQRSAWDTQEILKQRILEFSGFNFNSSSEEYFNRDMMLKTQPNDVLVKMGHVLGLDQIRNMYCGGDNARLDLISAIMQFLTSMKSLNTRNRRRGPYLKPGNVTIDPAAKNLQTKCGCLNRCLAKVTKIQRSALLDYLKELEEKKLLDSYLFNLIEAKKNIRRPGEEKQKFREIKYEYKAKLGPKEFTVCKGGFAVYHGLKQSKLLHIQNSLKNETDLPPKVHMKDFPPFNVPESHKRSNTRTSMPDTANYTQGSTLSYKNEETNSRRSSAASEEELKEIITNNKVVPKLIVEKLQTDDEESNKYKVVSFKRKTWEKEDMFNAMTSVKQGDMGCGVASKKFNVPRSTLKRYMSDFYESDTSIDEFLDSKLGLSQHVQKSPKDISRNRSNNPQAQKSEQEEDGNSNEDKPVKDESEKKKLKEFPLVVTAINNASKELLIDVHFLLFLDSADDNKIKDNILNFSGFTFDKDTEEYDERNEFLQRMSFKIVSDVARSFSLEILNSKEDTIKNILAFLEQPAESYLRISSNVPLSLSDVELDDIDGFSDSDESITCEVVEKKVECIDLISSGEDSDDDKPRKAKSPKKAVITNPKPPSGQSSSTPTLSTPSPSVPSQSTAAVVTNIPSTASSQSTDTDSASSSQGGKRNLRNFETICKIVNTHPHEYLVDIFDLLYLKKHEPSTLRKDILDFSGFTFEKGSGEYVKRKQLLDRMLYNSVRRIYNTLIHNTTEVKVFSKPTMIAEIFQFLFKLPDHDTSIRPTPAVKPPLKPVVSNTGKSAPVGIAPPPGIPAVNQNGKLSDLKRVFQRVACFPCEYLIDVHKLLFMTDCDPKVIRQNIFAFKGFKFGPESQEFQQRKMYLEYLTFHSLRKISSVLTTRSVDLRNSTKHELATHLTQVLAEYCNTYSDTEVPEITTTIPNNSTNQNAPTSTVTSTSSSSKAVETIVVTPSIDPSLANPPVETPVSTVQNKSSAKAQKQSTPPKSKNATTKNQPSAASPLPISIVDTRSVPQNKRKRKSNTTVSKILNEKSQPDANQFADINLPEVEKYRQMYGQSIYNPNLPTITGITTFSATGVPQTFPIAQPMSFPIMQVQPSQVIGVPVISQVQGTPSEIIVPGESDVDHPSKKQKVVEKSEKRGDLNNDDEEDCDKPLASLIGHPIDNVLEKNIADIVEQTNLQDITINKVIQKIYSLYPKFDLSYRKEFIKSTVRNLLYKLGEKNNSSIPCGGRNTNSPDCSVTTTDIQDNSMDESPEASAKCS